MPLQEPGYPPKRSTAHASPAQGQLSVVSTMGAVARVKRSSAATRESATRGRPERCWALGQKSVAAYHGASMPGSRMPLRRRRRAGPAAKRADEALLVDEARRLGYASRDPLFGGTEENEMQLYDDRIDAFAVPVRHDGKLLAIMNLVWPRKYKLKAQIVRAHLADMQETAAAIAAAADASPEKRSVE